MRSWREGQPCKNPIVPTAQVLAPRPDISDPPTPHPPPLMQSEELVLHACACTMLAKGSIMGKKHNQFPIPELDDV